MYADAFTKSSKFVYTIWKMFFCYYIWRKINVVDIHVVDIHDYIRVYM